MLKFKGSWRSYQKRILDNLEYHLLDEKLHIVAAPGAGKTTLGLEVVSRINRPSLILCPTNTIKNQWKERVCSAFLEKSDYGKVSTDIRNPGYLTVITYQALLAAFCEGKNSSDNVDYVDVYDEKNEYDDEYDVEFMGSITSSVRFSEEKADEVIKILKKAKVSLLCFDEAHHLRKEWWKALTYLVDELEPKQTVSLTATPPYDVDYSEWERYESLCGPIDEVISIPELVSNGDLCPHQDFIHFSLLRESENEMLKKHSSHIAEFLGKILSDRELYNYLAGMSFLNPTDEDVEKIFDNPEMYVAIASLLKSSGLNIPKIFLKLFDARENEIPSFNISQAKAFLNGFLITNCADFKGLEQKIEDYFNMAKRLGLVQNKKIVLNDSVKIQKQIANSIGKLDSIVEIVMLENSNLGSSLRMVILTDYIKENDTDNSHLGVVPIWRTLKDKYGSNISIGVLCGSLIIMPANLKGKLYDLLVQNSLDKESLSITQYKDDDNYIRVTPKDTLKHRIVSLITDMFNNGDLTILIGTQALLGEGWDAPSINSLILSSTVSSYMLSNQMRGRAIRIDKNNPDKISNIWHLASVKIPNLSEYFGGSGDSDNVFLSDSGYYDLSQLTKRFEGFEAPSYFGNHDIENGISRVISENFKEKVFLQRELAFENFNKETMQLAKQRYEIKKWWEKGLYLGYGTSARTIRAGVDAPENTARTLVYEGYKHAIIGTAITFVAVLGFLFSYGLFFKELIFLWAIAFAVAEGYIGFNFLRTGSVSGILKQITIVILETLSYLGYIKTSLKKVGVHVDGSGSLFVSCANLQTEENNLVIKCLQEFLDPIDNPRYLLIKRDNIFGVVRQRDYFAIPAIISTRKKDVQIFEQLWNKYIGRCEIVYTRNVEGRSVLLKARKSAFSSTKREKSKKLSKWQ